MKLPNGEKVIIDEDKLIEYVLSPTHRKGRHHAELFERLLGIDQGRWWMLYSALRRAAADGVAVPGRPSPHGRKYEIRFQMTGPRGDRTILSAWMIRTGEDRPRLVTAYVL